MRASEKDNKKNLAWYWLSMVGVVGVILGALIGGQVGSLITIFAGHLFLLFSLAAAVRGGIDGNPNNNKLSAGSRAGAFLLALTIALVALVISTSLMDI